MKRSTLTCLGLLIGLGASACGTRKCKNDTLLVSVSVDPALHADSLLIDVMVEGGGERSMPVPLSSNDGTIEIDFSSYPVGKLVTVTATAQQGAMALGSQSGTVKLAAGCDLLQIPAIGAASDLGMPSDLGDDASPDLSSPPDMAHFYSLSLLAGQPAGAGNTDGIRNAARFNSPNGMVSDATGMFAANNVYVADYGNNEIRRIDLQTGNVSTVAGGTYGDADGVGTAAQFKQPSGLALAGGSLYVADYSNNLIRKIKLATGEVTTVAGQRGLFGADDGASSASTFSGPFGLAFDASTNLLYVAGGNNKSIRVVDVVNNMVSTLPGITFSSFVTDVVLDGAGNLYVTGDDSLIHKIVLGTTPTMTTFAGSTAGGMDATGTSAQFNQPAKMVMDAAHANLYVADAQNATVRQVTVPGAVVTTLAGAAHVYGSLDGTGAAARFYGTYGVALDGQGNILVSDQNNNTIRNLVISSKVVTTPYGSLPATGTTDGVGSAARFTTPVYVAAGPPNTVYVSDSQACMIRQVDLTTGNVTTLAGTGSAGSTDQTGTAASFNTPMGLAFDGTNLYVADSGNNTIRQITTAGVVTTIAGSASMAAAATDATGTAARFNSPTGLALDGAGNLFILDSGNYKIRQMVISSKAVTTLAGTGTSGAVDATGLAASFSYANGLAYDGATSSLYVADTNFCTIRQVTVPGAVVTTIGGAANMRGTTDGVGTAARFTFPRTLVSDGAGGLLISDTASHTIRRMDLTSHAVTTILGAPTHIGFIKGPAPAGMNSPWGLYPTSGGSFVIVDRDDAAIYTATFN